MAFIFAPISPMASSHDSRRHLPPDSRIGYFNRRSPWPCSRTDAPLAQCAPRLNGESKSGSCPVQTPFCTSAITPQPTEQWVQMERRNSTGASRFSICAWAPPARATICGASAAPPTAKIPERRKNSRRDSARPKTPTTPFFSPPLRCLPRPPLCAPAAPPRAVDPPRATTEPLSAPSAARCG